MSGEHDDRLSPATRQEDASATTGENGHGPLSLAQDLGSWRHIILRYGLISTSAALIVGSIGFYVSVADQLSLVPPAIWALFAFGFVHLGLLAWTSGSTRVRSMLFLSTLSLGHVLLGLNSGWVPAYVIVALFLVVMAGLLLGRAASWAFIVIIGLTFLAGAALSDAGVMILPEVKIQLYQLSTWIRVAVVSLLIIGGLVAALGHVIQVLVKASTQAEKRVHEIRDEQARRVAASALRVDAEISLRDAQKMQTVGQVSHGLAHMFNNGLTILYAAVDKLRRAASREQVAEASKMILGEVTKASQAAHDLLLLSRKHTEEAETVQLQSWLSECVTHLRIAVRENVRIELSDPASISHVRIAPVRLRQALLNLVLNASDAMPGAGTIRIDLENVHFEEDPGALDPLPAGDYVAITVSDSGNGMDKPVLARACEAFFTTKENAHHDGLGLSVALGIAQHAGGSLQLSSAPGEGTRVRLFVPLMKGISHAANDSVHSLVSAPSVSSTSAMRSEPDDLGRESLGIEPAMAGDANPPIESGRSFGAAVRAMAAHAMSVSAGQQAEWQRPALVRLVTVTFLIVGVFFASIFVKQQPGNSIPLQVATQLPGFAMLAVAFFFRRTIPYWFLFAAVVTALAVAGGHYLLVGSLMGPAVVAAVAGTVVIAAVFTGRRVAISALFLMTAWFVLCGALLSTGVTKIPPGSLGPLDTSEFWNWLRISWTIPLILAPVVYAVLSVVGNAQAYVGELERVHADLLKAREARQAEDEALLLAENQVTQAARLETAGQLVGSIAHDLNNVLLLLSLPASMLSPDSTRSEVAAAADDLGEALDHMTALVPMFEGNIADDNRVAVNVSSVVHAAVRVLRRTSPEGETLKLADATSGKAFILAGRANLQRILLNLVTNARDAIAGDGTIVIRVRTSDTDVIVEVEDSGTGMAPDIQSRIYDAFFTTKASGKGTGLGLHTVERLVGLDQGNIEVRSQPGAGTTFTLQWPTCDPPRKASAQVGNDAELSGSGDVLLAEDNDAVRGIMVRALEQAGFRVFAVSDGDQALAAMESDTSWGALCTDGVMPGCPVDKLIRVFSDRYPGRPILLCSGSLNEGSLDGELPDIDYLRKPFTAVQLCEALIRARQSQPESRSG